MTREEIKNIYVRKFPVLGLGERMANQLPEYIGEVRESHVSMIFDFNAWSHTNEGNEFWRDVYIFYIKQEGVETNEVSEMEVRKIFQKHNITP